MNSDEYNLGRNGQFKDHKKRKLIDFLQEIFEIVITKDSVYLKSD